MRNDLIESLVIGSSIAFVVLAIHALTDSAPPQLQLLALLVAGGALFCGQLALTIRRARRNSPPPEEHVEPERQLARLRHGRRNPFYRELTHDWTGLDEHIVEHGAARPQVLDDRSEDMWNDLPATGDQRPNGRSIERPDNDEYNEA